MPSSYPYNICQQRLLNEEISKKHKVVWTFVFNLTSLKNDLNCVWNIIDFVHITTVFLTSKNNNIQKVWKVQGKRISVTSHVLEKVLLNFSNYSLAEHQKSLLSRGLNFAILPKNINYADYLLPLKLLFRDNDLCEVPS